MQRRLVVEIFFLVFLREVLKDATGKKKEKASHLIDLVNFSPNEEPR